MCARRFLIIIFVLTLLTVAAGVAIFQFGGNFLIRQATPRGHFQPPPMSSRPDYVNAASWLARPGSAGDTDWLPKGVATAPAGQAAIFYVHPTTYLEREHWNAPLDPGGQTAARTGLFLRSQASAFNAAGEIWAPRYRQAAYGAFLLQSRDAAQALDLAYRDVLAAFDTFIAALPKDKPLVLAAHSQGSLHLLRLIADRRQALAGRVVAAYVVGWPVSRTADLPSTGLPACAAPDSIGCVLSWQSYGNPANPSLVLDAWEKSPGRDGAHHRRDMICTNPISGSADGSAEPADNPGTLVPTADLSTASLSVGQVGGRCVHGLLQLDGAIPPLGPYVLPGNNYHVYDYALFWGAIRRDVERRLGAWGR